MKERASRGVFVERDLLESIAFRKLSGTDIRMFFEFMLARVFHRPGKNPKKSNHPICINNGQLVLPYRRLAKKLKVSQSAVGKCLDRLIAVGLIEITEPGNGTDRIPTKYAVSEKWRQYDGVTPVGERQKDSRHPGFQRLGHAKRYSEVTTGDGLTLKGIQELCGRVREPQMGQDEQKRQSQSARNEESRLKMPQNKRHAAACQIA